MSEKEKREQNKRTPGVTAINRRGFRRLVFRIAESEGMKPSRVAPYLATLAGDVVENWIRDRVKAIPSTIRGEVKTIN